MEVRHTPLIFSGQEFAKNKKKFSDLSSRTNFFCRFRFLVKFCTRNKFKKFVFKIYFFRHAHFDSSQFGDSAWNNFSSLILLNKQSSISQKEKKK